MRHPRLGGNDTKTALLQPFERSKPGFPGAASEPTGHARGRNGSCSRILRTAKEVVVDFGKYAPTIEFCMVDSSQQRPTLPNHAMEWPQMAVGKESTIPRDPYGLISRWKLQQENVGCRTSNDLNSCIDVVPTAIVPGKNKSECSLHDKRFHVRQE